MRFNGYQLLLTRQFTRALFTRMSLLGIAPILIACAASPYVPDLRNGSSKLRIVAANTSSTKVAAFNDSECNPAGGGGRIAYFNKNLKWSETEKRGHEVLGIPGGNDFSIAEKHELLIPTGKELTIAFSSSDSWLDGPYARTLTCDASISFYPSSDQMYELVYSSSNCASVVYRLEVVRGRVARRIPELVTQPQNCKYPRSW